MKRVDVDESSEPHTLNDFLSKAGVAASCFLPGDFNDAAG